MMKVLSLLLLLSGTHLFSQTKPVNYIKWYELKNEADYQYQFKKNPTKSLAFMTEAEHIHSLDGNDAETMAHCYLDLGDTSKTIKYLELSIRLGNPEMERIRNEFKKVNARSMSKINKNYPDLVKQFWCEQDIPMVMELKTMNDNDQLFRIYHKELKKDRETWLLDRIDSTNIYKVKEIYKQTGVIPGGAYIIFWHCLHNFPDMWRYFEPEMRKAVFTGSFMPQSYAGLYDRVRVIGAHQNSWYGEFTEAVEETNAFVGGKIDDVEHVDERRKEIGLRPLIEMNEIYGWTLPPGYKDDDSDTF